VAARREMPLTDYLQVWCNLAETRFLPVDPRRITVENGLNRFARVIGPFPERCHPNLDWDSFIIKDFDTRRLDLRDWE
jgi:hypothetical protein